jgi:methionyl-tRNA formyltransferase
MTSVHLATSRPIGERCIRWVEEQAFKGLTLVADPEKSDVFISVMYDSLVSEAFIEKRRCYNFHPGILPEYRGSGAFSWAIINGEKRCGVTLHELETGIDSGPVIATCTFPIEPWDTAETLFGKGMDGIFSLFCDYFLKIIYGDYLATPQDEARARTYYRKDLRAAADLTRFVRAFAFAGKECAYYVNAQGRRIDLKL